jgi:hypothetical protein
MTTTVAGERPVNFNTIEDLITGYRAIVSPLTVLTGLEEPEEASRFVYELSILNNIRGEILCLVQDINKRTNFIDELTTNLR